MSDSKKQGRKTKGLADAAPKSFERAVPFALVPARHFWSLVVATLLMAESSVAKSGSRLDIKQDGDIDHKNRDSIDDSKDVVASNSVPLDQFQELPAPKDTKLDAISISSLQRGDVEPTNNLPPSIPFGLHLGSNNLGDFSLSDSAISKVEGFVKKWLLSDAAADSNIHLAEGQGFTKLASGGCPPRFAE